MYKAIIFDLDGTLLDSLSIWDEVGNRYLSSLSISTQENIAETCKEMSLWQSATYMKNKYNIAKSVEEIISGINTIMETFYRYEVKLKPHVSEMLHILYEKGIKMCVATASDKELVMAALRRNKIDTYIQFVLTCDEVKAGKDEPIIYEKCLSFFQMKKEEVLVFEDAYYAIQTVKKAGFLVVGVKDRHASKWEEIKSCADTYIEDFKEIGRIIL